MPKISKFLRIFFPLVLASIAVFLCIRNYTPGTYLMGWDSVHPEFNFQLNAGRMLSHVWGGEMGVGAISAHSDMSDLPKIFIEWISSLILPTSFVRYFYIFSCLIVGPLGVYFFLKYVFQREKDGPWIYPAAFLGGLFYLLNLGTLQNFYVPLEMFTVAFAGSPWLFLAGLKYLREGKKKNLFLFAIIVILISPMAYAATQAYVIYLGLFLFLISFAVFSSGKKLKLKRFLKLGIVAFLLNIYWILPNVYSIVQQSQTISNANINRLFSQESFLRNADFGDIGHVLIQKNFLFSWRNFDFVNGEYKDLLDGWNRYLGFSAINSIGYGLAFLALIGILLGTIKKEKISLSFILPLLISLFFLFNANPPLGKIYQYLYNNLEIFREGFRTPFTKFSILFEFILSFYFGYFCYRLFTVKIKYASFFKILIACWLTGGIIVFSLPAFYGNLIGQNVRVKFPSEYSQLFDWFKNNSEGRIALMPINTKFGWEYRNWGLPAQTGYEGSGFLTYGIKNPILYRDFDRWNSANEDFYNQSAFALYSNNNQSFVSTLKKYQVKYVLLDESMVNAGGSSDILKISEIKDIAGEFGWKEVANFNFLTVYDTGFGGEEVTIPQSYSRINTDLAYSSLDTIYSQFGDYIASGEISFPLINLDRRSGVGISLKNNEIEFKNDRLDISMSLPATNSARADLTINQGFDDVFNCDLKKLGTVSKEITQSGLSYKATDGGVACDYISFPDLGYLQAYVLHITGENKIGRSLKIYLFDSVSQTPYVEEILPVGKFDESYFVYPRDLDGKGYVLNFETRSFGRIKSENLLTEVEFYSVDYAYLVNYESTLQGSTLQGVQNDLKIVDSANYGNLIYKVQVKGSGLLELNQGFENGWVAIKLPINNFKFTILDHIKVNSWANGWLVPNCQNENCKLLIVYWPQFLEWGGLFAGVVTLLVLVFHKNTRS